MSPKDYGRTTCQSECAANRRVRRRNPFCRCFVCNTPAVVCVRSVFVRVAHGSLPKFPRAISTARAKRAVGRLDFNFTLVLRAGTEPECAAGGINRNGAGTFVWIIDKLVESDL